MRINNFTFNIKPLLITVIHVYTSKVSIHGNEIQCNFYYKTYASINCN